MMDMNTNRRGRSNNIIGWSAPHIHFTAESFKRATEPVVEAESLTPYEEYLESIGMLRPGR